MALPKWEDKNIAELKGPTADQIWPFLEDFCNIIQWFPDMDTCYEVEGEVGKPGRIRYCARKTPVSDGQPDGTHISWAKEKPLMINPTERCLSYEVLENNIGFKSYVATIKALPINQHRCKIEWSFTCDPFDGWKLEDLKSYLNSFIHGQQNGKGCLIRRVSTCVSLCYEILQYSQETIDISKNKFMTCMFELSITAC